MPVYTVHAPTMGNSAVAMTEKFTFVRDGFHFWAALLSVVWLAWHRLWLALVSWIVLMTAVGVAMAWLGAGSGMIFLVNVLFALLLGFEAASLERWTLSRRDWQLFDIVVAADEEAAERRFFDRWTAKQRGLGNNQLTVNRGGPPPTRDTPSQPFSKPPSVPQSDIIGWFPEPGALR